MSKLDEQISTQNSQNLYVSEEIDCSQAESAIQINIFCPVPAYSKEFPDGILPYA